MVAKETKKVALVTGASRGIGAAIAQRLAADGFITGVNYTHSAQESEDLVKEIEQAGGQAFAVQGDVSDAKAMSDLFDTIDTRFGRIDVVVNNAGVMALSPIAETEETVFDRLIAINLKGTFNVLREAGRRLHDGGSIINFSSSVVGSPQPGYGTYAATKAAVETLTSAMAKEMRGRNITVNAVAPGPTETKLFLQGKSDELVKQLAMMAPMERLGQPEDIANVVSFLASEQGHWINGQTIRANGGMI